MKTVSTPYGTLSGVEFRSLFSNGKVDGCLVTESNILQTPYGALEPQYQAEDMGRRSVKPLYFYKNGAIKSVALQTQSIITTPIGTIPAELVSFYESGAIKRIFPLDGKLSGFWSWKNEFALAVDSTFSSPLGLLTAKVIGFQFYETGALKSITLWPGETLTLPTPIGTISVRKGVAFYESGALRSCEPARKIDVVTPIGTITAYDNEPNGIHGDTNSLQFNEDGSLEALSTIDHAVEVTCSNERYEIFQPGVKRNVCGDERRVSVPMPIRFSNKWVMFHNNPASAFHLQECSFIVKKAELKTEAPTYSCAG